jgi:hypothetical protein
MFCLARLAKWSRKQRHQQRSNSEVDIQKNSTLKNDSEIHGDNCQNKDFYFAASYSYTRIGIVC